VAAALDIQAVKVSMVVRMARRTLEEMEAATVVAPLTLVVQVVIWVSRAETMVLALVQVSMVHLTLLSMIVVKEMSVVDKTIKEQLCL